MICAKCGQDRNWLNIETTLVDGRVVERDCEWNRLCYNCVTQLVRQYISAWKAGKRAEQKEKETGCPF